MPPTPSASGPVGRHGDVDHRIVEAGIGGVGLADRRIGGQVDDAFVIVGEAELALRQQHAVRFDAADDALLQLRRRCRGCSVPAGAKTPIMPARALGAPHTTCTFVPSPGSTMQTRSRSAFGCFSAETTRAMRNGAYCSAGSCTDFDLEADHGELVDDAVERRVGVEMLLEPGRG